MKITPLRFVLGAGTALVVGAGLIFGYLDQQDDRERDKLEERPIIAPSRIVHEDDKTIVVLDLASIEAVGIATVSSVASKMGHQVASFGTVVEPSEIIESAGAHGEAKARLAATNAKLAASMAAWNRAKLLFSDGRSMSQAQMQTVEEAYHSDEAARLEAQAKLDAVSEAARQVWGDALAKSISDQGPAAKSYRSGKQLLVRVAIPGSGQPPVKAELSWDGGGVAVASLVGTLPKVDPRFQQRLALYSVPALDGPAPGATVGVQLASGGLQTGAMVPASALVWWDGSAWIYTQADKGKFSRLVVPNPEAQAGGLVFVAGLPADQMVVVQGAQVLLSEESRDKIQVGEEGRSK